jgi:hypothetical protein
MCNKQSLHSSARKKKNNTRRIYAYFVAARVMALVTGRFSNWPISARTARFSSDTGMTTWGVGFVADLDAWDDDLEAGVFGCCFGAGRPL